MADVLTAPLTLDRLTVDSRVPIRFDGVGSRSLVQAVQELATAGHAATTPGGHRLPARFRDNAKLLAEAHRRLTTLAAGGGTIPAECEWLLDNAYAIEGIVREVRTDLPRGYYRELPAVPLDSLGRVPRIYPLAVALLAYSDSALTEGHIRDAVKAYQEIVPLGTGELWAVPTMLRLALLENLRRLTDTILAAVTETSKAEAAVVAGQAGRLPRLPAAPSDAFAIGFHEALRDNEPPPGPGADAVQQWTAARAADLPAMQHREYCRQAAAQVSIGNIVTSLRLIGVIDWLSFVESVSLVEARLAAESGGAYLAQDFATRDACRRAIEDLGRGCGRDELEVARATVVAARKGTDAASLHIAWPLLGEGRRAFEQHLKYRPKWIPARQAWVGRHPHTVYFGLLAVFYSMLVVGTCLLAGVREPFAILAIAVAALLPLSEVAQSLVNFVSVRLRIPTVLPKLEFKNGIPDDARTFVVIPALIGSVDHAATLLERLEHHYLANPDPQLRFALLTDVPDAATETMPDDAAIVQALLDGIARLNATHPAEGSLRFHLGHRRRQFNAAQNCWMGWERKRGKIDEFNLLLRGAAETSFATLSPGFREVPAVRFVLTLDADTVLPGDAARRMIATLAHPLNRPRLSADGRRVIAGYALLQPRVSFLYRTGFRSWFARLFAGSAGVDPYSAAVSDTYMDLFGEGTFTGKGLYDVDAFTATAGHAFPENRILSHDLVESTFARCALVSDVEVYDEFPTKYHAYAKREHRWIRGDWQLLPWLGRTVPTPTGRAPNVLPVIARWKIVDNLRRSLVPFGIVVLLVPGWTVLPGSAWVWTLAALAPLFLPTVFVLYATLRGAMSGLTLRTSVLRSRNDLTATVGQAAIQVAVLPFQAWQSLDAIARTLYRLQVSGRRLLEWETAAAADARLGAGVGDFIHMMAPASLFAILAGVLVGFAAPEAWPVALPVLLAWLCAPVLAFLVSRPRVVVEETLTPEQQTELRLTARKTWDFFETFVGPRDHWLPPDNFQEEPKGEVAHRTSPTNIGLYLLSTLAAHDLGYLSAAGLLERLANTFDTLDKLQQHNGHFLNWYDTLTLAPLPQRYVSTVDSGNLLACFLTLKHGLLEKAADPACAATAGLTDTLAALRHAWPPPLGSKDALGFDDLATAIPAVPPHDAAALHRIRGMADDLAAAVRRANAGLSATRLADRLVALATAHAVEIETPVDADRFTALAQRASAFADGMDFRFLYNTARDLFAIGFNLDTGQLDGSYYDLLASEACIGSFLAIARGQVPRKHWFRLGRLATRVGPDVALISWGGTMFEYLMPRLLLPTPTGVLLDRIQHAAVRRQIEFGRETDLPWGVSESGYYQFDGGQVYQYLSFGVPGLGLKRGLDRDRVIAPYATLLAVDVLPAEALANLERLKKAGADGPFGFYEAVDYTPARVPAGRMHMVVRSYMAHHQGMALLAIVNRLTGGILRRRFRAEPCVRAAELLLEERVPYDAPVIEPEIPQDERPLPAAGDQPVGRRITTPDTPHPRTHLLSNGHFTTLVTAAGGGFTRFGPTAVTRWRADPTNEDTGLFLYIRDRRSNAVWSAGHQPVCRRADVYEVTFALDKVDFRRIDDGIETLTEVTVVPDQNVEVRRVTLTNLSSQIRHLDVTSYAEVVLDTQASDLAHPAFGKLFIETEFLPEHAAVVARRRPRSPSQAPVFAVHMLASEASAGEVSCETDREKFLGRGRTVATPYALTADVRKLSGTTGAVLDPIFALRRAVRLRPGERATLAFSTAVAPTREAALTLADLYHAPHAVTRAFELAWAHARVELQHAPHKSEDLHLYQRLAGLLLYPVGPLRAAPEILVGNRLGQAGLWRFGISGDLPIALLKLHGPAGVAALRGLLFAQNYWRSKGLPADVVVLLETAGGYMDELQTDVNALIRELGLADRIDQPGGIFTRKGWQLNELDRLLLLAAARVVLDDRNGLLTAQADAAVPVRRLPDRRPTKPALAPRFDPLRTPPAKLQFANGTGGFTHDDFEYVITRTADAPPPAPWSNVIANPAAGFLVTDSGGGFAWAGNSQSNRLTPWSNDPVADPPGDVVYLHDDAGGAVWSATPLPSREGPVIVRHGQGYTVFERAVSGIAHELTVFVPISDPVKISLLKLTNHGAKPRKIGVAYYVEWVLGTTREVTAQHVITELDPASGALFARNPYNADFNSRVAVVDISVRPRSVTGDRTEFLGRNGQTATPGSFDRVALSGRTGAGLDPCGAVRGTLTLPPGEEVVVVFVLGQAADAAAARKLVTDYCSPAAAEAALNAVVEQWDRILGAVQVRTPDAGFDLLTNRWLLYQTLSCRFWGRSAVMQSGGAYGFRDQLQDATALIHAAPQEVRSHLLRAASRQFVEGDVQHWWHEPAGNGVRTRFSDDFLWLPYAACLYSAATADLGVWDEPVPFLSAPPLNDDQHEVYSIPQMSEESGPLYDHAVRALDHGWRRGQHSLPLMGGGDWNDGMNTVGSGGKGESIWVAWFQIVCYQMFAAVAARRGDETFAGVCKARIEMLREALEATAWDGDWYRRAYFDDGTPLGSATNDECKIDSLAQSWAVIAGVADPARAAAGMQAVMKYLVRPGDRLVLLFEPPFDRGPLQPGYIKGYLPGVRENGGQYTHAATWVVKALAGLGRGDDAFAVHKFLNPIYSTEDAAGVAKYRGEPYAIAADVYSRPPHVGRAGWTWYTGSSAWLYRVGLEDILGLHRDGVSLRFDPCIPAAWPGFTIRYKYRSSEYVIEVTNPQNVCRGVRSVSVEGTLCDDGRVRLIDDRRVRAVSIVMGIR